MGCITTKVFQINEDVFGFDEESHQLYKSLGLTSNELNLLYTAFYDMDSDSSGAIRLDEFLVYFGLERGPFYSKVFGMFDIEDIKCMNFAMYVCTLWYVLSLDTRKIPGFAFRVYDPKNYSVLSFPIIEDMLKAINNGDSAISMKIQGAIEKLPGYGERRALVSLENYLIWSEQQNMIFAPVLTLIYQLRSALIGQSFWKKLESRRIDDDEMSDIKFDVNLKEKIARTNLHFIQRMRRLEVERAKQMGGKKEGTRTRLTVIMINKLKPKKSENMREAKEKTDQFTLPKGYMDGKDIDEILDSADGSSKSSRNNSNRSAPSPEKGETSASKTLPKEKRHRRSIFKPNLVIEAPPPKSSKKGKVGPSAESSGEESSSKKYREK